MPIDFVQVCTGHIWACADAYDAAATVARTQICDDIVCEAVTAAPGKVMKLLIQAA